MKNINSGKELNQKILKGVNILADAVSATLGPKGRNVIIKNKNTKPFITKDGVTVCDSIELEDPFENLGAQIIKQAASATVASCGDGTTTSTVLARAMLDHAHRLITPVSSLVEIKKGMDLAVEKVLEHIKEHVEQISSLEQIENVATISANGDKAIGKMIAIAVDKIGKDGSITIQEGRSSETSLDVTEGFTFDSGLLANHFITDERRGVMRYEDCLVLVTDMNISMIDELLPALTLVARENRPFIIIAEQVEGQALGGLIYNKLKGELKVAAIKAPLYGEDRRNVLSDLAVITGATFLSREIGTNLRKIQMKDFGQAKIVESSKFGTTIVSTGTNTSQVNERIDSLKHQLSVTEDMRACEKIQDRITRLSSGVAVIKVGAATEVEMIEKKHRIEDALEAVQSAQQEGIIIGGGMAFINGSDYLYNIRKEIYINDDQDIGIQIIYNALREPFYKMAENCDKDPKKLLKEFGNFDATRWLFGYDFAKNEKCALEHHGIIDPFKVIRCSLQNATSAAGTLLTTAVAIVEA